MKCRVILVSLFFYFLLGCASAPQPVPQIECRDSAGTITYRGTYDEEYGSVYVRRPSEYVKDTYSKAFCQRTPEPVKEVIRSPEPVTAARKLPAHVETLNKSPEPVKALSRSHERTEAFTKSLIESSATANYLHKSAEAGNMDAQNQLGLLYHEGRGVPQNFKRASLWFRKAAEQGHAGAQVNLGTLYFLGRGVSESDHEALFWFRKAAAQRDALAFAKLGRMYELGRGVPQDFVQAHMWYNLSAAHGEKQAVENRDALTRLMGIDQIAEAQRLAAGWKPEDQGAVFSTSAGR